MYFLSKMRGGDKTKQGILFLSAFQVRQNNDVSKVIDWDLH